MSCPPLIRKYPWATFGRRENSEELFGKWRDLKHRMALLESRPLISVIFAPSGPADESVFKDALCALRLQSYSQWEALFVFTEESKALAKLVEQSSEPRFRCVWGEGKGAALKNLGLKNARGEWIGVCEAEGMLSPVAFSLFMRVFEQRPDSEVMFSNEILLGPRRRILEFISKGELNWFTLLHGDAVGRFYLVRRGVLEELGPYDESFEKLHERDFLLKALERGKNNCHLPAFLYYRRSPPRIAEEEETTLVEKSLRRVGVGAEVHRRDGYLAVCPKPADEALVSVIICFRDKPEYTLRCVRQLLQHRQGVNTEIFLVNNGSTQASLDLIQKEISELGDKIELLHFEGPFNFAAMHNWVVKEHARGQYLFLLNNDVFLEKGSLGELVGWARFDWVGTVGIQLRYPHGQIQHAGIRARFGGSARLVRLAHVQDGDAICARTRTVFANTFAACLMRRQVYQQVGGLDAIDLANGFGDIAFNFECLRLGLQNIYLSGVQGLHLESASRGTNYEYWEEFCLESRYPDILQRMLREDAGFGRIPAAENTLGYLAREARETLLCQVREIAPWLKPIKQKVRRWLFRPPVLGNNEAHVS